jgi:hypothetical protein
LSPEGPFRLTPDGQEITKEIACVERQDLTPVTLGLSPAEGKAVRQALQEVVVECILICDITICDITAPGI